MSPDVARCSIVANAKIQGCQRTSPRATWTKARGHTRTQAGEEDAACCLGDPLGGASTARASGAAPHADGTGASAAASGEGEAVLRRAQEDEGLAAQMQSARPALTHWSDTAARTPAHCTPSPLSSTRHLARRTTADTRQGVARLGMRYKLSGTFQRASQFHVARHALARPSHRAGRHDELSPHTTHMPAMWISVVTPWPSARLATRAQGLLTHHTTSTSDITQQARPWSPPSRVNCGRHRRPNEPRPVVAAARRLLRRLLRDRRPRLRRPPGWGNRATRPDRRLPLAHDDGDP